VKHGKFDFVLCTGDFFGLVKETYTDEDELSQLLDGKLEGRSCYIMPFSYSGEKDAQVS